MLRNLTASFFCAFVIITICNANVFNKIWSRAIKQTLFEQEVEDVNSIHKIDNHLVRRLIVMVRHSLFIIKIYVSYNK